VTNDLGVANLTDAIEKFEKVTFGGVERQIPHVQFRRSDLYEFRLPANPFFGGRALNRFFFLLLGGGF